jgi:CheY-like chemotaxis protein
MTDLGTAARLRAAFFELLVQEPQALDRSRGGLGLGLTLVKRLAELHNGSVAAASAGPGQGSEFTVRLPIAEGALAAASPTPPMVSTSRPRRVLIVEDNADARESLQLLLQLAGHEVETAPGGPSGLRKLQAFRPDVALIDLGLPGFDGYDLVRHVRRLPETQATRCIAVTGYGQAEDRRRALDAGFDVHLTKPVDPERLQRLLAAG